MSHENLNFTFSWLQVVQTDVTATPFNESTTTATTTTTTQSFLDSPNQTASTTADTSTTTSTAISTTSTSTSWSESTTSLFRTVADRLTTTSTPSSTSEMIDTSSLGLEQGELISDSPDYYSCSSDEAAGRCGLHGECFVDRLTLARWCRCEPNFVGPSCEYPWRSDTTPADRYTECPDPSRYFLPFFMLFTVVLLLLFIIIILLACHVRKIKKYSMPRSIVSSMDGRQPLLTESTMSSSTNRQRAFGPPENKGPFDRVSFIPIDEES